MTSPLPEAGPRLRPEPVEGLAVVMERPHPLTPLVKGWIGLVGLVVYFGRDAVEHLNDPERPDARLLWALAGVGGTILALTIISGYFNWRFTRFLIDDQQVLIERNFLSHNSDRVPFSKIQSVDVVQPFAARLLGLARLHIDVGAGQGKTIEYLTRDRAYGLRNHLISRAHGKSPALPPVVPQPVDATHPAHGPRLNVPHVDDRFVDRHDDEVTLLRVSPQRIVLAALISLEMVGIVVGFAIPAAISVWLKAGAVSLAIVIPLVTAIWGLVARNLMGQWNYQLIRTASGALKISRGMTSLVSQTVPVDRIQGVSVIQQLPWRPFGLFRVRIDVLGNTGGEDGKAGSDVLLPAGTWDEVCFVLDQIWPGFRVDRIERRYPPKVARWFEPIGLPYRWWGYDDEVIVSVGGAIRRVMTIVAHARAQSVHLTQGPLLRRVHLADVSVDTTAGILGMTIPGLDEQVARELVLSEMDRCRDARARGGRPGTAADATPEASPPAPAGAVET